MVRVPGIEPPWEFPAFVIRGAEESGTYHPSTAAGDAVAEGQEVGEIRDLFGDRLRVLRAPATGTVLFLVTSLAINAGDPLLGIGVPSPPSMRALVNKLRGGARGPCEAARRRGCRAERIRRNTPTRSAPERTLDPGVSRAHNRHVGHGCTGTRICAGRPP
jgi:hypothetical protein